MDIAEVSNASIETSPRKLCRFEGTGWDQPARLSDRLDQAKQLLETVVWRLYECIVACRPYKTMKSELIIACQREDLTFPPVMSGTGIT